MHYIDQELERLFKVLPHIKPLVTYRQYKKACEYIDSEYHSGDLPTITYSKNMSVLFLEYETITIGIEKDGHAHS